MVDCYWVLGVRSQADDGEIKAAFRRLAKTFHPDLNPGDRRAEQRFRDINRAYATLRDPAERERYDRQCVRERARARQRRRAATLTMSACFASTVILGLLLAAWMQVGMRSHKINAAPQALSTHALPLSLGVSD